MHLIERLTRIDPDTVAYEYTVTDPTVYTAPLHGDDAVPAHRRTALRVRLPRGELRAARHPGRGAETGTAGPGAAAVDQGTRQSERQRAPIDTEIRERQTDASTREPMGPPGGGAVRRGHHRRSRGRERRTAGNHHPDGNAARDRRVRPDQLGEPQPGPLQPAVLRARPDRHGEREPAPAALVVQSGPRPSTSARPPRWSSTA